MDDCRVDSRKQSAMNATINGNQMLRWHGGLLARNRPTRYLGLTFVTICYCYLENSALSCLIFTMIGHPHVFKH